jgi:hypothetical protein
MRKKKCGEIFGKGKQKLNEMKKKSKMRNWTIN